MDPFLGSGTTAIVAKSLNRNYIGIDILEEYCELSKKDLLQLKRNCYLCNRDDLKEGRSRGIQ